MEYPYTNGNMSNPPKYFYADSNMFDPWWKSRDMTCNLIEKDVNKFVKKFEVAKGHRKASDLFANAVVFERAYKRYGNIIYLNTLLKCIDILCSIKNDLDMIQKMRLCELIHRERKHVVFIKDRL